MFMRADVVKHIRQWLSALLAATLLLASGPAAADIYMYRDADGVMHFTNTPSSPEYRLYIRTHTPRFYTPADINTYDRIIKEASRRHGVDFCLVKAIIQAESSFNPQAVSKKGARGLMQIMPENFPALNIKDPSTPIRISWGAPAIFACSTTAIRANWPLVSPPTMPVPPSWTATSAYRRSPRPSATWKR